MYTGTMHGMAQTEVVLQYLLVFPTLLLTYLLAKKEKHACALYECND